MSSIKIDFDQANQLLNDTCSTEDISSNGMATSPKSNSNHLEEVQESDDYTNSNNSVFKYINEDNYSDKAIGKQSVFSTEYHKENNLNTSNNININIFGTGTYARCGLTEDKYQMQSYVNFIKHAKFTAVYAEEDNQKSFDTYINEDMDNKEHDNNLSQYSE